MTSNDVKKGTNLWVAYQTAQSDHETAESELEGAVDTVNCGVELDTSGYYERSSQTYAKHQAALEEFKTFCTEVYGDTGSAMLDEYLDAKTALKSAYSTAGWANREYSQNFIRYYGDEMLKELSQKRDQAALGLSNAKERLGHARTALDNLTAGVV